MNRTLRTRTILAAAAIALTAMSVALSVAGPAQAYDEGTCNAAAPNIVDVDRFKAHSGSVDFGDGLHLFGSTLGDAVVCWSGAGDVVIKGRLYADSSTPIETAVQVTVFHTNGTTTTFDWYSFDGKDGQSRALDYGSFLGTAKQVRIRLENWGPAWGGGTRQLVSNIFRSRGD